MSDLHENIHATFRRRDARLVEFIRLRREQQGLTFEQLASRIKRHGWKEYAQLESGQTWILWKEQVHLEEALELPPGFLTELREIDSQFGESTASEILLLLTNNSNVLEPEEIQQSIRSRR